MNAISWDLYLYQISCNVFQQMSVRMEKKESSTRKKYVSRGNSGWTKIRRTTSVSNRGFIPVRKQSQQSPRPASCATHTTLMVSQTAWRFWPGVFVAVQKIGITNGLMTRNTTRVSTNALYSQRHLTRATCSFSLFLPVTKHRLSKMK